MSRPTAGPAKYADRECPDCQGRGHRRVINGAWLRWRRERAGLTQDDLAAMLARTGVTISGPYLSDLERGRRDCPPALADLILNTTKG